MAIHIILFVFAYWCNVLHIPPLIPFSTLCSISISVIISNFILVFFNPLSTNFTNWSNTLKQFVGNLPTTCLSVLDHFVKLALKRISLPATLILVLIKIVLAQVHMFQYFCCKFSNKSAYNNVLPWKYRLWQPSRFVNFKFQFLKFNFSELSINRKNKVLFFALSKIYQFLHHKIYMCLLVFLLSLSEIFFMGFATF